MIKHRFVLDEAARSFLDLTARTKWTDVRLSVGGRSLGPPLSRTDLRDGQSYTLPDGSELLIQLEMPFLMPTLRIERDGVVVQGSDASLERLSARAGGWLMGLGGLNFLLGLYATSLQLGPAQNALFLVGLFFAICGFFARRGSLPGLVLGTGLFFLGVLQGLSTANTMTIVFQIALLTPMFRALHAHYLERTSAVRPLRRDHVPLAVVKSVIRPQTQFAETIAPASRPRVAAPDLANGAAFDPSAVGPAISPPVPSAPIIAAPGVRATSLSDQRFGPYVVTGTLGSGGMATVYQARQTSIGRDVALKVITGNHNADPEFGERFRREAETTARLSHPHILKVFDFGEDAGRPYLAMEYMAGGTLRGRIGATPLPVPQVLKWAEQIGPAIHSAHSQGVVHRDIKPENVLLDQTGNAFLADFGLARLGDARASLTQAGTQMGSPSYMAPEQWHGADVSEPADLYAFAAMLFELLTGRPPFRAASLPALMAQHLKAPVPSARAIRPSLPLAVDTFFAKALNKAPEQRFADASAMVDGLKQALRGAVTQASRRPMAPGVSRSSSQPSSWGAWATSLRPSPLGIAVAVLVVAILIAAGRQATLSRASTTTSAPGKKGSEEPTPPTPLAPSTLPGQARNLPYRVRDASYSSALDKVIAVAHDHRALFILDGESGAATQVDLPGNPVAVAVSPDGLVALVSHEGMSLVSVDLIAGNVSHSLPVQARGAIAVMRSWGYILPPRYTRDPLRSVNLLSGDVLTPDARSRLDVNAGVIRAHPSGRRLYAVDSDLIPQDLRRIDAPLGAVTSSRELSEHGDHDLCGSLWLSEPGDFAFTGCGHTFALSDDVATDMTFFGTIPNLGDRGMVAFAHSQSSGRIVVLQGAPSRAKGYRVADALLTYEFPGFRSVTNDILPRAGAGESPVAVSGRFVFTSRDGRRFYVVMDTAPSPDATSAIYAGSIK